MKKNPKVSIIIPVYNGSDYIKEAIDSALSQTYKNLEIIVVNDGSNDNNATRKIVKAYKDIKYYEKQNGGVSTALNLALEHMTGDYFSWLSHDDRYYPQKIEKQIEYLKEFDDTTILYSDYDLMDENSNIFAIAKKNHDELMQKKEYSLLRGAINGITLLIPKKAFEDCGNFREDLRCTQDYELWLRMMKKYTFIHQPEVLATTRLHRNQTTNTSPNVIKEGNVLWINIIESFTKEQRVKLEKSEYEFLKKMKEFMLTTPYDGTIKYLEEKIDGLDKKASVKAKNSLISIIIPFYNRLDCLEKAIESVIEQTHTNWELILVNDGTKDVKSIKKFLKDKRIKIINISKNSGASNARNIGMKAANGDYIALLDSDDIFLKNKLEVQLSFMVKNECDFSYTSYIKKTANEEIKVNCNSDEDIITKCISNCNIATPTVMFKASILKKYNLQYNVDLHYGEDICFYLEILKYTSGMLCDEYLTIVNISQNSASSNIEKQAIGLKNILKYVMNDRKYCIYDYAIAKLCYGYCTLFLHDEVSPITINNVSEKDTSLSNEQIGCQIVKTSKLKKYFRTLLKKGPIYCFKRVINKYFRKS